MEFGHVFDEVWASLLLCLMEFCQCFWILCTGRILNGINFEPILVHNQCTCSVILLCFEFVILERLWINKSNFWFVRDLWFASIKVRKIMIDKRMKKSQSMESDGEQVLILLKFLFKIPVSSIFVKALIFMAFTCWVDHWN